MLRYMTQLVKEDDFVQLEHLVRGFYKTSPNMPCQALLSVEYMQFKKHVLKCISARPHSTAHGNSIKAYLPGVNIVYCRNKCWVHACEPQNTLIEKALFVCSDDTRTGKRKHGDE